MAAWQFPQNKGIMQPFLMIVPKVNQRELVGIMKLFQFIRAAASPEQLRVGLDVLTFMHRLMLQ
eukprot:5171789-Prorocentrum_lima.AAC.1